MLGGVLLSALGGLGVSTASQPWELYVYAGIVPGVAFAGASSVPAAVLLAGWFVGRLGLASPPAHRNPHGSRTFGGEL